MRTLSLFVLTSRKSPRWQWVIDRRCEVFTESSVVTLVEDDDAPPIFFPRIVEIVHAIIRVLKVVRFGDTHVAIDWTSVSSTSHTRVSSRRMDHQLALNQTHNKNPPWKAGCMRVDASPFDVYAPLSSTTPGGWDKYFKMSGPSVVWALTLIGRIGISSAFPRRKEVIRGFGESIAMFAVGGLP
jgi:hypothetical protein